MKCSETTNYLHRYTEQSLDKQTQVRVQEHLATCKECSETLEHNSLVAKLFAQSSQNGITLEADRLLKNALNVYRFRHINNDVSLLYSFKVHPLRSIISFSLFVLLAISSGVVIGRDLLFTSGSTVSNFSEPSEAIYKLDAFNSSTDHSLYDMYTGTVLASGRGERE
jgi:hypothetical protein